MTEPEPDEQVGAARKGASLPAVLRQHAKRVSKTPRADVPKRLHGGLRFRERLRQVAV